MYYLQSRYYNPNIGRFLNADALVSTGQGVLGNNMFAYCLNNPVALADTSGSAAKTCLTADGAIADSPWRDHSPSGGGIIYEYKSSVDYSGDKFYTVMLLKYLLNTDEQVVLEADFLAFYHGVPVFKADFGHGGGLSFIIIILDDDYIFDETGINVIKHEYGHRKHLEDIGVFTYLITTAIPSLIGAGLKEANMIDVDYYSLPWEYVANMYGGVSHTGYTSWAHEYGIAFWLYTILCS